MTSDSIPTIKKRSRPQPRVRETSLEGENDTQQEDEEPQGLPCVNACSFHVQAPTNSEPQRTVSRIYLN